MIVMIIVHTCAESRAQRSFRNQITTATAEFEKSMSKARDNMAFFHSSQLYHRFIKFYFLKQIVTRKRAYPTRDCDNLPGPTYLYLTGIPEVYYLSYLTLYLKIWQNRRTNTFIPRFSRIILGRKSLH